MAISLKMCLGFWILTLKFYPSFSSFSPFSLGRMTISGIGWAPSVLENDSELPTLLSCILGKKTKEEKINHSGKKLVFIEKIFPCLSNKIMLRKYKT